MTVALVANIARPISSAISTAFSADSYGLLSSYGLLGASANPDAVIEALFANSEVGAWYDPSDLTKMFQDRAGTTPVTADGQTVGKILDKSGNNNHAVASSDAARPLYKTDGTYHWLQFDGVDDSLSTAAITWGTNKLSAFTGIMNHSNSAAASAFGSGNWNTIGTFECFVPFDTNGKVQFGWRGDLGFAWRETGARSIDVKRVYAGVVDGDGTGSATEVPVLNENGILITGVGGGGQNNTANLVTAPLYLGMRDGSSLPFNGNIYPIIVRAALSTTQEITDTETWVAAKTGVTL
jgi:hypothetical protein